MKRMRWISTLFLATALCGGSFLKADDGHDHKHDHNGAEVKTTTGPHGGQVHAVDGSYYEVVFEPKNVRVYLYDSKGKRISNGSARGSVLMKFKGNPKEYRFELYPEPTKDGENNSLLVSVDLSKIPDASMTTSFSITGVPSARHRPIAFSQTFRLTVNQEQLAIARQKICPVSGKPLGSMGRSIKSTISGRDVYVCCQGCTNVLMRDPAKYLARIPDPAPAKATKADTAAIGRQKLCPVMDEPLMEMGGPWKVYAKGQPIFVCCKGCIKKIQAKPDLYIAKATNLSKTTGGRR